MDFTGIEQAEGVRFIWNNIPHSRLESSLNIIPLSTLLTPFNLRETPITRIEIRPIVCQGCQMVANRCCMPDYQQMRWDCSNCSHRNVIPNNYKEYIQQGNLVPEFMNENATLEYKIGQGVPIVWFILIDTCIEDADLDIVRTNLAARLSGVEGVQVGLITIGKHIVVHDLASEFLTESLINGEAEYTPEKLRALLNLKVFSQTTPNQNRFIRPIDACREKLLKILGRLKTNKFHTKSNMRVHRATGAAINAASIILESFGGVGRLTAIIGGPCTFGQGKIVSDQLTDNFRDHTDLESNTDKIEVFKKSQKFYDDILERLIKVGITCDLFAFSLDQFGCAEMRNLVEKSGGLLVNQEQFEGEVFEKSLDKYVTQLFGENAVFAAGLKVMTSKDFFISGALGPLRLTQKATGIPSDADNMIGETGGNDFFLGGPSTNSTFLFFFGHRTAEISSKNKAAYFQYQITYIDKTGSRVMRVATFQREIVTDKKMSIAGFDQEAAIACISRLSAFKSERVETIDLVYWLNSVLIKFVRRFSTSEKDKPESLVIPDEISLIPQFMFYFRKSYFVQKFATSVDEAALYRMTLNRESLSNMLVMIQPALFQYDLQEAEPTPVLCDFESLKPDIVLLVDTYFYLLIWRGINVHGWYQDKMHEQPDYEHINYLFTQPLEDAKIILEDRLPVPKVITCHQGSPDERILKSKLNPPSAQSGNDLYRQDENYITDDVNMKTFMDYLTKLVVKKD
jgi:protein transport protein SEC23